MAILGMISTVTSTARRENTLSSRGSGLNRHRAYGAATPPSVAAEKAMKTAFLFPGQGSQMVGMGAELAASLPAAKELYDRASEVLGYDLLEVCTSGPKEKLDSTAVSQPAIYVSSLAAIEKLRNTESNGSDIIESCDVTAGLSLGEYTALTFAGAIEFEDGVRLVKTRGESMQAAADSKPSAMASVIGLTIEKVEEMVCTINDELKDEEIPLRVANLLCSGNYALSGSVRAIELVEARAKPDFKARMTVRLAVAGAFHSPFMSPAAEALRDALNGTQFTKPRIPVLSNVDAEGHEDPDEIRDLLAKQLVQPVLWETTLTKLLSQGLEQSYEIGPGKVIAGIMKRIDKKHPLTSIEA